MVVVHRAHGFRFVIYTQDHEPAHVHVTGSGHAKINLVGSGDQPGIVFNVGISRPDMRRVMTEIVRERDRLLAEWERIHGGRD